jgi:hypothetical protein
MRPSQIWRAVFQFFDFHVELQKVAIPQAILELFLSPVLFSLEETSNPSHGLSIVSIFHLNFQLKSFRWIFWIGDQSGAVLKKSKAGLMNNF